MKKSSRPNCRSISVPLAPVLRAIPVLPMVCTAITAAKVKSRRMSICHKWASERVCGSLASAPIDRGEAWV